MLRASSTAWGPVDNCGNWVVNTPQLGERGGWQIAGGYRIEFRWANDDFHYALPESGPPDPCGMQPPDTVALQKDWFRTILITPDGAEHELRPTDGYASYSGPTFSFLRGYYDDIPFSVGSPMRYYSLDGSYLWAVINPPGAATSWTVYLKDGTKVTQASSGIQRIQDTDGNSIKIYSDIDDYEQHIEDEQTGREIKFKYNTVTSNYQVVYQTVTGSWQTIDINYGTTRVEGKVYTVDDWTETGHSNVCQRNESLLLDIPVIRQIIFPVTEPGYEAQRYTFGYNSDTTETATDTVNWSCEMASSSYTRQASKGMGELSQMQTPTGVIVNYSYSRDSTHFFNFQGDIDDIARTTVTQKSLTHDGITDNWNYSIVEWGGCGGTVTSPDGSLLQEACFTHDAGGISYPASHPKGGLVYRTTKSDKTRVERHWTLLKFTGANVNATGNFGEATFNPVVDAEYTTLLEGSPGQPVKMSARTFQYDFNGNVIQTTEYDWFDPTLVTRDAEGVPTGVPGSATVLRVVNNDYYHTATDPSSGNVYAKRSLSTATPLVLGAPQQTTLGPSITQFSYDGQAYGSAPTLGHLTSQRAWDDLDSKWITSSQTYGAYGNLATKTDPLGKVTQFLYDDATHAVPNRVVVDPQNGTGTQTTATAFDYSTGLVTSQTDANLIVSTIDYTNQLLGAVDPFGRPGVIKGPLVNGQQYWVTTKYVDRLRQVIQASDLTTQNDQLLKTKTTSDELGRAILSEQTEDGTNYSISARNVYEQMGKISYSSNPMRASGASTDGWTRATSDTSGRVIEVATFSGATKPAATGYTNGTGKISTAYDANFTTVTDQAAKPRRSLVDALGRLVRLDEPTSGNNLGSTASPNQPTSYTYSVLGNLLTVTQGVQTRTFTYDSLSRLRTTANPESGTLSYQYDDNGNLLVKTDARGVSAHYDYDALNRAGRRWYNGSSLLTSTTNNSPTLPTGVVASDEVKYFYDTQALPGGAPTFDRGYAKGRLVGVTYGGGSAGTYRGYDASGAVLRQYQQTDSINYLAEAAYRLNGSMQSQTYPSVPGAGDRRTVSYTNDNAGRLASLSSAATSYAPAASVSGIGYSASGGLSSETYGNNLIHAVTYNSRLQTDEIKLGTSGAPASKVSITYNYGTTANNGSLQSTSYAGGGLSYTQTFGYDELNRLTTSQEGLSWSQTNTYDRYGNRSIFGDPLSFTASNNRITGWSYDAVGNLLNDGAHSYTFDAENKISKVDGLSAYVYDGDGQRVRKLVNENLRFNYGIGGQQIAEFDGATGALKREYVYGASGLVATIEPAAVSANGTRYTTSDHLGSPRVVTNAAAGVASRHDYMPFGEQLFNGGRTFGMGYGTTDGIRQKFTSYERDNETGLDYAQVRYYANSQGRFTSPDPYVIFFEMKAGRNPREGAQILRAYTSEPQNWNRYGYSLNDPVNLIDPTGLIWARIEDGDVTWYKDKAEMTAAGATEWTEMRYGLGNGNYVQLSATGPDANGSTQEARQGWSVFTQPSEQDPPSGSGYGDVNVSYGSPYFIGIAGGLMFDRNGSYPYIGGGFMNPGLDASATGSNDNVSGGFNAELQGGYGPLYGSVGTDQEGNTFLTHGAGYGASATAYYVFGAPHPRPGPHRPTDNNALNSNSNRRGTERPGRSNCACNR
jgi:RHS repeat-associated protein